MKNIKELVRRNFYKLCLKVKFTRKNSKNDISQRNLSVKKKGKVIMLISENQKKLEIRKLPTPKLQNYNLLLFFYNFF